MRPLRLLKLILAVASGGLAALPCVAQDLEPRRWGHLPIGTNFAASAYAYTTGDILFDPVLEIEDAQLSLHTGAFQYIRAFELLERTMRFDFTQGYQQGTWSGLLRGQAASVTRTGLSDTILRLSANLIGAPPLKGEEFVNYRKSVAASETIVGAAVALQLPTGHYLEDKLLNLGSNRFTIRPQLGMVHIRGPWSMELTGSAWIYSDNDEFFNGNELEQEPLFTVQSHLVYNFRPGLWVSTGIAYATGAQSTINGVEKDDERGNLAWGVSAGYPFAPNFGMKIGYIGLRTQKDVGADLDTLTIGFSYLW